MAAGEPDSFAAALAAGPGAERAAAAAPAQDVAVRDGGDVSHAAAAEDGRAIKKGPDFSGPRLNLALTAIPVTGRRCYFFFSSAGAFFFAGFAAFLVAFFID